MLQLELPAEMSALPIDTTSSAASSKNKETSVVVGTVHSSRVEMYSWQTMPAAVSMSGEKTQDMMNLTTFFQPIRHLLAISEGSIAIFFSKTIRLIQLSQSEGRTIQEIELFTGVRPSPGERFPPGVQFEKLINCAQMDCTGTIMAVASAAVGTVQPPRMKGFQNSVTITFFQLALVDKDSKPIPAGTNPPGAMPNFKQCH